MGRIAARKIIAAGLALAAAVGASSIASAAPRHKQPPHVAGHLVDRRHNHNFHRHPRHPHVVLDHSAPAHAPHHSRVVAFVDGYVQPEIPHPYPFDGKLAGDGILRTGILDSAALRAFGIVRN